MDLNKIIKTAKTLSAFISESVLDDEDLQSNKKFRRLITILSVVIVITFASGLPALAYHKVKVMMAPPPREQVTTDTNDKWIEFLERRIAVSLSKIDELEALLREARNNLQISESTRSKLEERIRGLTKELESLKRLSKDQEGGNLYDRLQRSRGR